LWVSKWKVTPPGVIYEELDFDLFQHPLAATVKYYNR